MNKVPFNGDSHIEPIPTIKQKALRINLNENIYGTFAEIGAGQETVRKFFRVGGASGTIAKAISCLLYTSPSPRDGLLSRMPSSA